MRMRLSKMMFLVNAMIMIIMIMTPATATATATAAQTRTRRGNNRRIRHLQSGADAITGELPPLSPEFLEEEQDERALKKGLKKKQKKFKKFWKKGWLFHGPEHKKYLKKMKKNGDLFGNGPFGNGPFSKKNKGGLGSLFNNNGPSAAYAGAYNAGYRPPRPPLAAIISPIVIASAIGAFVAYKFCGCFKDRELRAEEQQQQKA